MFYTRVPRDMKPDIAKLKKDHGRAFLRRLQAIINSHNVPGTNGRFAMFPFEGQTKAELIER